MSNTKLERQQLSRVIFIGDSGVGKTSIITRVTTGTFDPSPPSTIGAGVRPITFKAKGQEYKFHLWDTAGQEIYRSIVPLYFKQATCAIVVFAMDDANSFTNIPEWIELLQANASAHVPVIIVGNKIDKDHPDFEIADCKRWADTKNFQIFFTSAATGQGIQELFEHVTTHLSASQEPDVQDAVMRKMNEGNNGKCC